MIEVATAPFEAREADGFSVSRVGGTDSTSPSTTDMQATASVTISVVIPTLNEAKNLPTVFARLDPRWEIIVVDGRSSDDTVAVARALRPSVVILEQTGRGKGQALVQGFAEATGDVIVMLDADGSADASEIPRFVDALLAGAHFAKGSRFLEGGGSSDITRVRRVGNRALSGLVNVLFRTQYTDLCYGYNAFWRDIVPQLAIDCSGFEVETLMNIRIAQLRLATVEVPSFESERLHGVSNLRTIRDGTRVLRTIFRERFTNGRSNNESVLGLDVATSGLEAA